MRAVVCNPPAYFKGFPNRHFVQAGSRWSFSMDLPPGHDRDHYQPFPFNLAYLSSYLKREGHVVDAFDACALDMDEKAFKWRILDFNPDQIFVEVPTVSFPPTMRVLQELEKTRITVMGAHAMARPQDVPSYFEKSDLPDLSSLSGCLPDRDSFPIGNYHDFEFRKPAAHMLTSRGCPSSCSFCVARHVVYQSPAYFRRPARAVVDEMGYCSEAYGAKQVYFDDDTMTISPKHVRELCDEILDRGLKIPWTCMGDVTVSASTLVHMVEAGCIGIKFGVETVKSETLKSVGKTFLQIDQVKEFVQMCRKLGVWTHATYMIGLPGDRRKDVETTLKFAVELGSDSCQFSIATPFPGTPFFKECEANGWLVTDDWTRYDGARHSAVSYPWLSNLEIEELFHRAMRLRKEHNLSMREKVKA